MLRPAICARGASAAEMFYHPGRFTRHGAMPPTTVTLLQDFGSVQLLDGDAHRDRKAMFMAMMTPERLGAVTAIADEVWTERLHAWEHRDAIVLHDALPELLCRVACRWAGVPLEKREVTTRTRELGAMIESSGRAGPRNWWAQVLRRRNERWAREIIERYRAGAIEAPDETPLAIIASHRDPGGYPLDPDTAAVELINVLRPTVAVARYIVFVALALYHDPWARELARSGDDRAVESFVQEVRRYYPFFPFIGGRARQAFTWDGHEFREGDWVLLDIYGTNHDARLWDEPQVFRPERFRDVPVSPYTLIPQGAGDHHTTHRCPGEWETIALMKHAATFLTRAMRYDVPPQDLGISLSRMPALPRSGFVMRNIRRSQR